MLVGESSETHGLSLDAIDSRLILDKVTVLLSVLYIVTDL